MDAYPVKSKAIFLGAFLAVILLCAWEFHWRAEDYPVAPDDSRQLWAEWRAKAEKAGPDDVVLIGSSRILFDIQLDAFEEVSGKRPIMLAAAGASPIPVFRDIVENSKFSGTLIVGITPPLYFGPMDPAYQSNERILAWVEHYHTRTYADRLNHHVSKLPERHLAFLNSTEEGFETELDLKSLLKRTDLPRRVPGPPSWPEFAHVDKDRNITMLPIMLTDTNYVKRVTNFWSFILNMPPEMLPPPEVQLQMKLDVIDLSAELVEKFRARGGKVIFLRCPSDGPFYAVESMAWPKETHWGELLKATGSPGYHFTDYEFMGRYKTPEWSHLYSTDAHQFTLDLVRQMMEDGNL